MWNRAWQSHKEIGHEEQIRGKIERAMQQGRWVTKAKPAEAREVNGGKNRGPKERGQVGSTRRGGEQIFENMSNNL
jgi:hypothetical protein